jgi:O-antigen/teichoic acid export membrane protein
MTPISTRTTRAVRQSLRSFGRDGHAWANVLCDQVLVSGTSFLTTVVVGRVLGKEQLGLYVLAYSIIIVLLEIQNSFIASPYTLRTPRLDRSAQARYTGDALVLSIGLSVLAATGLVGAKVIFSSRLRYSEVTPLFIILSLVTPAILVKEFGRRVCFAHLRTRSVLLLDLVVFTVQIGGLVAFTHFRSLTVGIIYWVIGSASASAAFVWLTFWRRRTVLGLGSALKTLNSTWSFGAWVLGGNLVFVLSQQVYPWYLAWLKGPKATGAFAACLGLVALINPFVSAVGNYLGPSTANASSLGTRELSQVILRTSALLCGVVGTFCFIIVVLGNKLIAVIYGSAYAVDIHIIAVLAASVLVSSSTLALGFGFWAVGRPDMNLKINLLSAASALAFGPFLVSAFGLLGAAYGLLLANTIVSLVRVLTLKRLMYVEASDV